jgi:hypothetical protein
MAKKKGLQVIKLVSPLHLWFTQPDDNGHGSDGFES